MLTTHRWALLGLAAVPLVFSALMVRSPSLVWWTTHALEKIRPEDAIPESPAGEARIFAARNEFEPFQVVVRGDRERIRRVDLEASDLEGPGGAVIGKRHIALYYEWFLNLQKPSSVEGGAGEWPDPLIPRVDRYYGQRRNAFPFDLSPNRNQPIWVEVYVPREAQPGDYAGSITVTVEGRRQADIPVRLTVWDFTLPSTSSLPTTFGFSGISAIRQHKGGYTSDADVYALSHIYRKSALWHRVSIHGGSMAPPTVHRRHGKLRLDWTSFDAEVGPFLDGTVFSRTEPLHGARATSIDLRENRTLRSDAEKIQYYREFIRHFRNKGWADRLFNYLFDEPKPSDSAEVLRRGRLVRAADSQIKNLLTASFNPAWAEVVDIWAPLVNCLEPRPGFHDFCDPVVERDAYSAEIAGGKKLWWYQSCASHGCATAGGEYFRGWPSYMIDQSAVANRVMPWLAWKYEIGGELYFNLTEAWASKDNPWQSVDRFSGNGDGTLFYPGRPDGVGGTTHIPIESIRLKLIREGLEDYEYIVMLSKKTAPSRAAQAVNAVVRKLYDFERDPGKFYAARRAMGEELGK